MIYEFLQVVLSFDELQMKTLLFLQRMPITIICLLKLFKKKKIPDRNTFNWPKCKKQQYIYGKVKRILLSPV